MIPGNKGAWTSPAAAPVASSGPKPINYDREIVASANDTLGWSERAEVLGEYLAQVAETPLTVGIQGDWGSGKSSFINLFEAKLGENVDTMAGVSLKDNSLAGKLTCYQHTGGRGINRVYVLKFNSWVFAQSSYTVDYLLPVYTVQVIRDYLAARKHDDKGLGGRIIDNLGSMMEGAKQKAKDVAQVVVPIVTPVSSAAVGAALGEAAHEQVGKLSGFKDDFQQLVAELLKLDAAPAPLSNRLIIIVDDLDRIAPVEAVEITEKIKVFLDVAGIIFILAADLSIIQNGLKQKFGDSISAADGKNYLDKIVKIQYNVPQLQGSNLAAMMLGYPTFRNAVGLARDTPVAEVQAAPYYTMMRIFPAVGSNIRNVKRILLNFEFSHFLLTKAHGSISVDDAYRLLALTILYQYDYSLARTFYNWLADPARENMTLDQPNVAAPDFLAYMAGQREHDATQVTAFFTQLVSAGYSVRDWLNAYVATTMSEVSEQGTDLRVAGDKQLSDTPV